MLTPLAVAKNPGVALQELLTLPLEEPIGELERILIAQALTRAAGNKSEAARLLGIHRQTLYTKLKELEISDSAQEDF
jgi:two-component system NtrC family response regulator